MTELGRRLRQLRRGQERTLREVAGKAGCSEAYLSQVETGRASPSLASLKRIAAGYGVSIVDLFAEHDPPEGNQIVLGRQERRRLAMENPHVTKELLVARQSGKRMEPLCVTIAPRSGSRGTYNHAGEEFGLVLSGLLELQVESSVFRLRKGDSFYFSSTRLHGFRNPSLRAKTVVLWVITPPSC